MRGSFFFSRTWCAAIPIPTRSSDSSISSASCFVISTLDFLLRENSLNIPGNSLVSSCCEEIRVQLRSAGFGRSHDPSHLGNDSELCGIGKVLPESPKILVIQRIVDILFEITPQFRCRQSKRSGPLHTDFIEVFQSERQRLLEIPNHIGGYRGPPSSPHCQYRGKAGQRLPLLNHVVDKERAALRQSGYFAWKADSSGRIPLPVRFAIERQSQSWIADQQRRVC